MKNLKKGFTLVELLAVIVILAVILAIAIPNVLTIIENARVDALRSTAGMMIKAAEIHVAQNSITTNTRLTLEVLPNAASLRPLLDMDYTGVNILNTESFVCVTFSGTTPTYRVRLVQGTRSVGGNKGAITTTPGVTTCP